MRLPFVKRKKKAKGLKSLRRAYSYGEFMILFLCCSEEHRQELLDVLTAASAPTHILKHELPQNLNGITYGTLDDLSALVDSEDPIMGTVTTLTGLTPAEVYMANVVDVFGFINIVRKEVERINELFASVKVKYSSEEVSAGVKDLNFGSFGVLDYYARRMGITNQNDVRDVAWVRIYQCMKIDAEQNNYERRLRKQYNSNSRRK